MIIMEAVKEMDLTNASVGAEEIKQLGLVINDILQDLEKGVVKFDRREEHSAAMLAYETARVWSQLNTLTNIIIEKASAIESELEEG